MSRPKSTMDSPSYSFLNTSIMSSLHCFHPLNLNNTLSSRVAYPTPLIKLFDHAITTKYSFLSTLMYCRGHNCVYHIEIPCFRVMEHDQLNPLRFCYFAFKCLAIRCIPVQYGIIFCPIYH